MPATANTKRARNSSSNRSAYLLPAPLQPLRGDADRQPRWPRQPEHPRGASGERRNGETIQREGQRPPALAIWRLQLAGAAAAAGVVAEAGIAADRQTAAGLHKEFNEGHGGRPMTRRFNPKLAKAGLPAGPIINLRRCTAEPRNAPGSGEMELTPFATQPPRPQLHPPAHLSAASGPDRPRRAPHQPLPGLDRRHGEATGLGT